VTGQDVALHPDNEAFERFIIVIRAQTFLCDFCIRIEEENLAALIIAAIETVTVTARSMICKQMSRILTLIVLLDEILFLIFDALI